MDRHTQANRNEINVLKDQITTLQIKVKQLAEEVKNNRHGNLVTHIVKSIKDPQHEELKKILSRAKSYIEIASDSSYKIRGNPDYTDDLRYYQCTLSPEEKLKQETNLAISVDRALVDILKFMEYIYNNMELSELRMESDDV